LAFGNTGESANVAKTGTQIPWDRGMTVRLAVYESGLSGLIVSLLQSLGMDFFSSLEDYMAETVYETELYLSQAAGHQPVSGKVRISQLRRGSVAPASQ
jgi:hypothetical protein